MVYQFLLAQFAALTTVIKDMQVNQDSKFKLLEQKVENTLKQMEVKVDSAINQFEYRIASKLH